MRENAGPDTNVFGVHAVLELVRTRPNAVEHLYLSRDPSSEEIREVLKRCRAERIPVHRVPPAKLSALVHTHKHQGIVAVSGMRPYNTVEELRLALAECSTPPLLLVPASIEDPRNLGSIIRSSVALGVQGILLEHKHTAPLSAVVAKSSAGTLERVLIIKPRSLEAVVGQFRSEGFRVIGADASGSGCLPQVGFSGPAIIVLGGEDRGIPPYLKKLCTDLVRIPSVPGTPSLNVGVAAGIMLYEAVRQRRSIDGQFSNPKNESSC